jgi:tripartite ATP-independent transporter DctM subunit
VTLGLLAIGFLVLLFSGMWIPLVVAVAGLVIIYMEQGLPGFRAIGLVTWGSTNSAVLTAVPLFILMSEILLRSGVGHRVYRGLNKVMRRMPGGLLQSNILGCAVFSAISGSSVATAASIGTVAIPAMRRLNYDIRVAAGSLAAGGSLGNLIPPSIAFIIYGMFTETSIVRLLSASVVPGLLMTAMYMGYIAFLAWRRPEIAPVSRLVEDGDSHSAFMDVFPFILLIGLVLGTIYLGYATPTEAAAIGSAGALLVAVFWGDLNVAGLMAALRATVTITSSILFIVITAYLFSYAIAITDVPNVFAIWIKGLELTKWQFLIMIFCLYIVLGLALETLAMIVITIPLLLPILAAYNVDLVWFGVAVVILMELGAISPPYGLILFVIQRIGGISFKDVALGSLPFNLLMIALLALMCIFPGLALWLPSVLH